MTAPAITTRGSGILLHPTSLPGPYGIGDLGLEAYRFVDLLAQAQQAYWQILPLGPVGCGESPYQAYSAFAGNTLLISPQRLIDEGLLSSEALDDAPQSPAHEVDYSAASAYKQRLLDASFAHLERYASAEQRAEVEEFAAAQAGWLPDFALFMALKDTHGGAPWNEWELELVAREQEALQRWSERLAREIRVHVYAQYLFFKQWRALKEYTTARGVRIIGDAPIFVAHDSADCWVQRELFYLDETGRPSLVAGVPPDYFSATGQLWGNPLYRWDEMARTGYAWWIERLRSALDMVDLLRLDHFRGFAGYWAIPGDAPSAQTGEWRPGPGAAFFEAVEAALGPLPLIAEDLGVITPDVVALRDRFGFPGMRVLQFAFGGDAQNEYLPHNYVRHCVAYTGTHDNDTSAGWLAAASESEREHALAYMGSDGTHPVRDLMRLAFASVADTAIVPLQDVLELGSHARMNRPGQPSGNWRWRYTPDLLTDDALDRLAKLARLYGRAGER